MCGPYDSVLGRRKDRVLKYMTTNMPAHFEVATGDVRMCGALAEIDDAHRPARSPSSGSRCSGATPTRHMTRTTRTRPLMPRIKENCEKKPQAQKLKARNESRSFRALVVFGGFMPFRSGFGIASRATGVPPVHWGNRVENASNPKPLSHEPQARAGHPWHGGTPQCAATCSTATTLPLASTRLIVSLTLGAMMMPLASDW